MIISANDKKILNNYIKDKEFETEKSCDCIRKNQKRNAKEKINA